MKKAVIILLSIVLTIQLIHGQGKYLTRKGLISFYSHTMIEDITAINEKVAAVIDGNNGDIAIIVKMNEFIFEKKLMQEHFNENYVESHIFPRATFNGKITNNEKIDYTTPGTYKVKVGGKMLIHGVTRDISTDGTIEVTGKGIIARTKFLLNPEDYDIKIPRLVRKNIAENMEITTELVCNPVK